MILDYWKIIIVTMVLYANVDEMQALFAQTSGWIDSNNCSGCMLDDYVNLSMFSDREG